MAETAAPSTQQQAGATGAGAGTAAPASSITDAYSQLDGLASDSGDEQGQAADNGQRSNERDNTGRFQRRQPDQQKPAEQQQQPPKQDDKPARAKDLREAYERLKSDFAAREAKLKEYEAEKSKWTSGGNEEVEKLRTLASEKEKALSDREKRLNELETELRYSNYERSDEYQKEYWSPFQKAFADARQQMNDFDVTLQDGSTRAGTAEDFDRIAHMDYRTAKQAAQSMFGDDWQTVMGMRKQVVDLNNKRAEAIERYRKEGGEREKQKSEAATRQARELSEKWNAENKAGMERFPDLFKPVDGETKENDLLASGFRNADLAFSPPATMSPEERVKLHSAIRNMAGGFPRLAYKYKQTVAKLKATEAKLKEYEDSDPNAAGGGRSRGGGATGAAANGNALDAADAELAKLVGS